MDIPISGYFFELDEAEGSRHTHNLYITTWNGSAAHVHQISGVTSSVLAHQHHYFGTLEAAPTDIQHIHRYFMYTTVSDGHVHEIRGVTGPAIYLPGGGHYHEFQGETLVAGLTPHTHLYKGITSR